MKNTVFYHAGCSVCVSAEKVFVGLTGAEEVHLGKHPDRVLEAESLGVKSVPALVLDGQVFHINHGADLSELKG